MRTTGATSGLAQHYRGNWGQIGENCPFAAGPVQQLPVDFEVLRFKPTDTRPVWTYATVGMSQPSEPNATELHIFAPEASPSIVELLYATAHFHRTASPLGVGHSVNFGRPWLPGSSCDHGLVSLPYLDGPRLEDAWIDGVPVRCLWLIPITASEVAFKRSEGLDALEARFDDGPIEYANPLRDAFA